MKITFKSLTQDDFVLLLKWFNMPHVKTWWDRDVEWTIEKVQKKYKSYVNKYKSENGVAKEIYSFIIEIDHHPIGYIQMYNAYDFTRSTSLAGLPTSLAAIDFFIGEKEVLRKGVGTKVLEEFINKFCLDKYEFIFVDPDSLNIAAIKTYEKCGFKTIKENIDHHEIWMLKELKSSNNKCNFYKISCLEPYITFIEEGKKTIEGRVGTPYYTKIRSGDIVCFYNRTKEIWCKIIRTHAYPTFKDMLEKEGLKKMLPHANSIEEGVQIYRKFPTFLEKEHKFGAYALEVKLINLETLK